MRFILESTVPRGMPSNLATSVMFLGPYFPKASKMLTSSKSSLLCIFATALYCRFFCYSLKKILSVGTGCQWGLRALVWKLLPLQASRVEVAEVRLSNAKQS